jgi:anti-anti-sigma factor
VSFSVERREQGDSLILRAAGELEEHDCGTLVGALRQGLLPGIRKVVLDFDALDRLSSAALTILVAERHRLADDGRELVLVCANERIHRLISYTRVDRVLPTVDSVEEAVARGGPGPSGGSQPILGPTGLVG